MKRGLYREAGASATIRAAAWANWLVGPTTNLSNVYRPTKSGAGVTAGGGRLGRSAVKGTDAALIPVLVRADESTSSSVTSKSTVKAQWARDSKSFRIEGRKLSSNHSLW